MAYNCIFCGEQMSWVEKDIYRCSTHGRFERQTVTISEFKWLEAV